MLYTVYSGSLSGPAERVTDDPALALHWGREAGPHAFVTQPTIGDTRKAGTVVWTPQMDRICTGHLHQAVIDRAVLSAVG
jgi:hypothetical protein